MSIVFNFVEYSAVLTTCIKNNLKNREKPIVIGIHGEWGSGKSTLLKEIEKESQKFDEKRDDFIIVPIFFNAWRFEKEEHLIVPLLKTLYYELDKKRLIEKNSLLKDSLKSLSQ